MKALHAFFILTLTLLASLPAMAQEAKILSSHKDWTAFTVKDGDSQICYMASNPKSSEPKGAKRGDITFFVSHKPAENTKNVVSFIAGYPYQSGSQATLSIDGTIYKLFTHQDMAWAKTAKDDTAIANALRKGSRLTIKGTSQRGTNTTDTFSLSGTGAAYDAISKACNVK